MNAGSGRCNGGAQSAPYTVIASAVCWVGFAVVAALVLSHRSDRFDEFALQSMYMGANRGTRPPPIWLVEAVRMFTSLGGPLVRNLFASAAAAALLVFGERVAAARYVLTVIGAWLIDVAVKAVVARPRPTLVPHLVQATGYSFPSGHSLNGAAVYMGMALALTGFSRGSSVRTAVIVFALLITWLVCLTRIWLGVHYPTDVLAGWLGGTGCALFSTVIRARGRTYPLA